MTNTHIPEPRELIERLKNRWSREGVRFRPGATLEQIESWESRSRVRLPADLREYFSTVDGMEKDEMDSDLFSFLPIHAVKSIPEELAKFGGIPDYTDIMRSLPDPQRWFVIVDYSVSCAACAIRLSAVPEDTPVLWIWDGTHHRVVAPSFTGFLEAYLAN